MGLGELTPVFLDCCFAFLGICLVLFLVFLHVLKNVIVYNILEGVKKLVRAQHQPIKSCCCSRIAFCFKILLRKTHRQKHRATAWHVSIHQSSLLIVEPCWGEEDPNQGSLLQAQDLGKGQWFLVSSYFIHCFDELQLCNPLRSDEDPNSHQCFLFGVHGSTSRPGMANTLESPWSLEGTNWTSTASSSALWPQSPRWRRLRRSTLWCFWWMSRPPSPRSRTLWSSSTMWSAPRSTPSSALMGALDQWDIQPWSLGG